MFDRGVYVSVLTKKSGYWARGMYGYVNNGHSGNI